MFTVVSPLGRQEIQPGELLLIGRGSQCDIRLDDPSASRVHCRVLARDGKVYLTDAGSRWGTFVNGHRVTECELRPGDEITVGETVLTVRAEGTPQATTLARHSEVRQPWSVSPQQEEFGARSPVPAVITPAPVALPVEGPLFPGDYLGRTFLRYEVTTLLERTASGLVFRANARTGSEVKLQLFHPAQFTEERARQRFLRAIETMRGLQHPHLEQLQEGGLFEGIPYIVSEYVAGKTVAQIIQHIGITGMLDWRRTLAIARDLAAALEFLEDQGVVHRNLMPQNILVRDADGHAQLTGLLLAKALDEAQPQVTLAGEVLGEVAYQSPEQLGSGEPLDIRSDIYQFGATLYALLTGRAPFTGRSMADTMAQVLSAPPTPPTKYHLSIPPLFEGLVLRLLGKRPQDRLPSARKLVNELDRIQKYCGS